MHEAETNRKCAKHSIIAYIDIATAVNILIVGVGRTSAKERAAKTEILRSRA